MADTNSTGSNTNLINPTWVDQTQPVIQVERQAASGFSLLATELAAQAKEKASEPSPAMGAGSPEKSPSTPQFSRRVWHSDEPYRPVEPTDDDGDHWKKLYEKASQFDKEFCGGWNSEIDALLTFAGLFSAVVTAFTVESYKLLQPDPQDMTNHILLNLTTQLMGRNTTTLPEPFTPSASSLRINTLWFLSLTFSLTAGLVGILCKQWLRHYQQDISKPPREALAFRQYRYDSFLRCRVMDVLNALPVLLGLGLILFFIGLIDFLQGLDVKVSIPVTILIGVGFIFLAATTLAPALQHVASIQYYYRAQRRPILDEFRPPLFAFKSPQSLAILHLVTWLFPALGVSNWTSSELSLFRASRLLRTYTGHALIWLDETYSHSQDVAHQICLCLLDIDSSKDRLIVEDTGERGPWDSAAEDSSAGVIKSLFGTTSLFEAIQAENHVRSDIIVMRYLRPFGFNLSFNQISTLLQCLIRASNSLNHRISLGSSGLDLLFRRIFWEAHGRPALVERAQEIYWQKEIHFWNFLSEGPQTSSNEILREVHSVFENLKIFTDEDLDSIFNALHTWIDRHPEDADLPSRCWVSLTSQLRPHELDDALQHRPPVRDFMAFLDSRFQLGDGVKFSCNELPYCKNSEEMLGSFFKALYAWIEENPQDTQSFI
ncbi:hypothetical protein BD779DRAFT_1807429 [Infundibulicybe gibba]|nr:hypothetical protein BD779DRAFT_1807429 [Infundibulicybe gibba]